MDNETTTEKLLRPLTRNGAYIEHAGLVIAKVNPFGYRTNSGQLEGIEATAKAMQAAPEMLALLQGALKAWQNSGDDSAEEFEGAMGMLMPAINRAIDQATK